MCGQHWGRDEDSREVWQALIPASWGHYYCSQASQMSATCLILLLADSLPFLCVVCVTSFKIHHPNPPDQNVQQKQQQQAS